MTAAGSSSCRESAVKGGPTERSLRQPLLGLEHEMGLTVRPPSMATVTQAIWALLESCGVSPGVPATQFLANGARVYLDAGDHPEYATPECASPAELVAADLAGCRRLGAAIERAEEVLATRVGCAVRLGIYRNNVSPNGATWGTHENYLVPAELSWGEIAEGLVSHLTSRICFTGSGTVIGSGAKPRAGMPLRAVGGKVTGFRLSQRAPFIARVLGSSAMSDQSRPMILGRDEPLADPRQFRRVQVCCGDASVSPTATLLKTATTSIALRLVEAGAAPVVRLRDPVGAMCRFGADVSLQLLEPTTRGRWSALDMQWEWLNAAAALDASGGLPECESAVLPLWAELLSDLERDPDSASDRVDWVAKLQVLRRVQSRSADGRGRSFNSLVAADLAYHDLHPRTSLGVRLLNSGWFRQVVAPEAVDALLYCPPVTTRALLRSALVAPLASSGHSYELSWDRVRVELDGTPARAIRLDDPWATVDPVVDELLGLLTICRADRHDGVAVGGPFGWVPGSPSLNERNGNRVGTQYRSNHRRRTA